MSRPWTIARRIGGCAAVWLVIALILSGLSPAAARDVRHDLGGSIRVRLAEIDALRARGERVRILGTCVSACTLYLGLPDTCVAPSARLGFHGPSAATRGLPLPRREFERVSAIMAGHYPARLRRWFWTEGRMRTDGYVTLSGAEVIRLGARACP